MTFRNIKDISDEEFINILKCYLPEDKVDEIYNNKLSKYEKKAYMSAIIALGSLTGVISVEMLDALLKDGISLELTSGILIGFMVLSYIGTNKFKKKELDARKEKFNEKLINIKTNICNLSEEEFNMLVSSYEYITHNNLASNINSNVSEVIEKLVSINAIGVLKEFEIENNSSESSIHYEDEKNNLYKMLIKSN